MFVVDTIDYQATIASYGRLHYGGVGFEEKSLACWTLGPPCCWFAGLSWPSRRTFRPKWSSFERCLVSQLLRRLIEAWLLRVAYGSLPITTQSYPDTTELSFTTHTKQAFLGPGRPKTAKRLFPRTVTYCTALHRRRRAFVALPWFNGVAGCSKTERNAQGEGR